jgi:hypothetical protein
MNSDDETLGIRGWVYAISNPSMPGLVKVGFSTKDPSLRANELGGTGSPTPFEVIYDVLVLNPRDCEQKVHKTLTPHHHGKEWFRCSPQEAVSAIRSVVGNGAIAEKAHPNMAVPLNSQGAGSSRAAQTTGWSSLRNRRGSSQRAWCLKVSSDSLLHKQSGKLFVGVRRYYEKTPFSEGFALGDVAHPWVRIEDVDVED